jgi:two-component system phosphate regulon response regulator OmpR
MGAPEEIPHILIVDDDARLRKLLAKYLGDAGWLTTAACDAEAARKRMEYFIFDAAVVDVMMPGISGVEFTHQLRSEHVALPILMLTAMGETEDRISGLEAGADDYLAKPFEPRELRLRLENLLRRTAPAQPERKKDSLIYFGEYGFDTDKLQLQHKEGNVALTTGEALLLKELLLQLNQPVSRDELAQRSQGTLSSARSVDVQINRLRRKIEKEPARPEYIHTIRGEGYMLRVL